MLNWIKKKKRKMKKNDDQHADHHEFFYSETEWQFHLQLVEYGQKLIDIFSGFGVSAQEATDVFTLIATCRPYRYRKQCLPRRDTKAQARARSRADLRQKRSEMRLGKNRHIYGNNSNYS